METSTEESLKITNEIMQSVIPLFKFEGDLNQMKIQIHPIIANGMYHRDKK